MSNNDPELEEYSFRRRPLNYDELTTQLKAFEASYPALVRLESAGRTPEGRELWVAVVGTEPDRLRPSAWLDGNMHASELAGSCVALAVIEDLLRLHSSDDLGLPTTIANVLREGLVYVMPRMSPDGAETVLKEARYVRSVPRAPREGDPGPHWVSGDLDGDGRALLMRVVDSGGEFVESNERPGLMLLRRLEDEGPFYKLYPEGRIANFDGVSIPAPDYLSDNDPDLNRNFPYHWAPEPTQRGAGPYALSALESRAVVAYTAARPHLYVWLNLHCFGGVHIRPSGNVRDSEMDPYDRAVYRQLGDWAKELTGYPMVSGFEEFTYSEGQALHGDLLDYAYLQRGCLAWVCELWDIFEQLGFPAGKRFVDRYTSLRREDYIALFDWDRRDNEGRLFPPWHRVEHPQLGPVEVGGMDPRFGIWNPPPDEMARICDRQAKLFFHAAALVPRLRIVDVQKTSTSDEHRIRVRVENLGYLPTNGVQAASEQRLNGPIVVNCEGEGFAFEGATRVELGVLSGWGHGVGGGFGSLFHVRSAGSDHRGEAHFIVRGSGKLRISAGCGRTGFIKRTLEL